MKHAFLILAFLLPIYLFAQEKENEKPDPAQMTAFEGFFDFFWDATSGKIWLKADRFDEEFLFVHGLAAGLGSNDIGLDRGQISAGKVVSFQRSGPKVLLVQTNYDYRAQSDNPAEQRAVEQAFATSVIWGFEIVKLEDGTELIDLTPLLLSDQHGVINRLQERKQGTYKIDPNRSAVYTDMLRAFPENCEFEATITFAGKAENGQVRSVTPSSGSISLRQHLSFVQLPGPGYEPRPHHPYSGFIYVDFFDYAQPIDQPLNQRYIIRHRLEKKDPTAASSEAVEPIIYYLDPGTPEPVRSALLEGARWWNEAFEKAGYRDAFQVQMLPEDADPLDVRYNVIQWVHRSTRGWSYGASVVDPRTGEIIKGHVSLGSLRVRQDFLIAQGLVALYAEDGENPDPVALEMALARLRQLSAHEVGHTLGLTHNFSASMDDRASVMDYPHPLVTMRFNREADLSDAYATGIGSWDNRVIWYGYQDFPDSKDPATELQTYLRQTVDMGFRFISDTDARPQGGAHPEAHLWDNGIDPAAELIRILELRSIRLKALSYDHIPQSAPAFELERLLSPLYLSHRYQTEAAAKLIGGVWYAYHSEFGRERASRPVRETNQEEALEAILATLLPDNLCLPESVLALLSPPPPGYRRDREFFPSHTAPIFDPVAAAETAAAHSINLLLQPDRLARIARQHALGVRRQDLEGYLQQITLSIFTADKRNDYQTQVMRAIESLYLEHLFRLTRTEGLDAIVAASVNNQIQIMDSRLRQEVGSNPNAHDNWLLERIRQFRQSPERFTPLPAPQIPPGSPIGCGH